MKIFQIVPLALITVAVLAGCNSPKHNTVLSEAHARYNSARTNPDIVNLAALELKEAQDSLNKAYDALSMGDETSTVDHLAYVASQKISIAQETAKRKVAEMVVANADVKRDQLRLEAMTAEANAARRQVEIVQATSDIQAEELAAANENAASDQALITKQALQLKALNAKPTKRGLVITLGDVLFSSNKSQLKQGGMRNMQKLAEFLNEYPQHKVMIEGYADSIGNENLNQTLSERRANTVRSALVDVKGIDSVRVATSGYGEEYPVASNDTATGRQLNRRVEIIISDEKGSFISR